MVLRREGLRPSHLTEWRKARDVGALAGLAATRRRPPLGPVEGDNERLRARNTQPETDLGTARRVIKAQGQAHGSLGRSSQESARRIGDRNDVAVRAEFTSSVELRWHEACGA